MARRRKSSEIAPSSLQLFPFLSVVACTLGSIMLLIIIISTKVATDAQQALLAIPESEAGEAAATGKGAVYVECREDGVTVYPGNQFISEDEMAAPNSEFRQFLSQLEPGGEEIVYLLIRPSGVEVFDQARTIIEEEGLDLRYEPIDENWQLDV